MFDDLYQYLVLHKQLSVPGIGTISLERKPAGTDITHRQITAPEYSINLDPHREIPAKKFFYWLADKLHIHYHEAIVRFNGFAYDLKQQVLSGSKITWDPVGTFSRGVSGDIQFEPSLHGHRFDPPVSATRMIREKAIHTVRVGEQEKTSVEMSEWLHPEEARKTYWWAPVLIIGIILLVFIVIYLSQNGFDRSSSGNQQSVSPQKPAPAYSILK